MELCEKVKAIREARGLSKRQFGQLLHCTGSWIGEIERGTKAPSDTLLTLMLNKMGVSTDWWETGEGAMFAGEEKEKLPVDSRRELAIHELDKAFGEAEGDAEKLELVSDPFAFLAKRRRAHREYFNGKWVFPGAGKTGHLTDVRAGIESMISKGVAKFMPHDLRRSFQTYCETLNVPVFTIKRLVGHSLPADVTAGYIQFSMPMLHKRVEAVAAYILRHAGRLPSANVVSLDEKKARHR